MKESDLYAPVKKWLEGQGLKVYPEVPIWHAPTDVIAIGEAEIVGVELKTSMTHKLLHQAGVLSLACHRSYVAVPTKPKSLERPLNLGIGVLRVTGGVVEVLAESAHKHGPPSDHYQQRIRATCAKMTGEGVGGVPCLEGVGPAQECKRLVDAYRAEHPKATWKELYEVIPNHYASHASMRNALTTGMALRAQWKRWKQEAKAAKVAE